MLKRNNEVCPYYFRWLGDLRKTTGPLVYTIFSSFIIATFIANVLCYFGVWTVIMTTAKQINVSFCWFWKFNLAVTTFTEHFKYGAILRMRLLCFILLGICHFVVLSLQRFKEDDDDSRKYRKTAKILVLFVIAYMAQWWPLVVYTVWSYIAVPHIGIIEVHVFHTLIHYYLEL